MLDAALQYRRISTSASRLLDALHALNVVNYKNSQGLLL
jgi:hypothetical protein